MNTSIYDFSCKDSSGAEVNLSDFRGKTLLIVNTASKCGFTPQYNGLQSLQEKYDTEKFSVLAFPCNQFGGQEPGSVNEIQDFCSLNFKTTFPVFSKIEVNGENAHPLYQTGASPNDAFTSSYRYWCAFRNYPSREASGKR